MTDAVQVCSAQGSICFELIKGMPAAFVTLIIGGIAAYIAFHQYRVARAKLNLDLFDRRYEIFRETWTFLSLAVQSGPPAQGFSPTFANLIPQASFLFGKRIEEYMRTASQKMTDLWAIDLRTRAHGGTMHPEDIAMDTAILAWFSHEASQGVHKLFGEYLDFEEWR